MSIAYAGPLRREPLAIELHNTLYAVSGQALDGFATEDSAQAWLDGIAERLPAETANGTGPWPRAAELVALRGAVRDALQAAVDGKHPQPSALDTINQAGGRAPQSPLALWRPDGDPSAATDYHGATKADIVISALAADAIALLTGPLRADLRACGAPGCVLMFLKDHPRRAWCSNTCGNRARQARHYRRERGDAAR